MQLSNKQTGFIENTKALNAILVAELKKQKEERVIKNLQEFSKNVEKIFKKQQKDFDNLMLNQDSLGNDSYFFWEYESYSLPFTNILAFYQNIYTTALQLNNLNVCKEIAIILHDTLTFISPTHEEKKEYINYINFLNIYFATHNQLFIYALEQKSIYRGDLGYQWYTIKVFAYKQLFNLDFLPLFDKQLFYYIRLAVDKNDFDFFKDLIEWFHSGIGFYNNQYSGLYDFVNYNDFDGQIDFNDISKLDERFQYLNTKEVLNQWLSEFESIKKIVLERESKDEEADKIIKNAHGQFLFSNLKELVHGIGAYLVKRQKFEWINFLWSFKQPEDADASWAGHSILPENINEFVLSLKDRSGFISKFDFREGHSSSSYYYRHYDLYLLLHLLSYSRDSLNISLSDKKERYIANLKFYIQKLEDEVDKIFVQNEILTTLKIKIDQVKLSNFLQNIKNECERGLVSLITNAEIRDKRVQQFKKSFFDSYEKSSGLKKIVKKYTQQYQVINEKNDQTFGINTLLPKDLFNSDLVMGIDMFGSQFARDMTEGENRKILDLVVPKCETLVEKEFSNAVKKIKNLDDAFIIAFGSFKLIMNNTNFEGAWRNPSDELKEFSSFEGRYLIDNYRIPVFRIFYGQIKNRILILNKKKFISIRQLAVDNSENNFYIDVHKISEYLKQNILEKIGTQEAKDVKEKELSQQVHLELYENFEVIIDENFEGYIVDL